MGSAGRVWVGRGWEGYLRAGESMGGSEKYERQGGVWQGQEGVAKVREGVAGQGRCGRTEKGVVK